MYDWNQKPVNPMSLSIAADSRLSSTVYFDDQIWELNFGNVEPPAITLQTTFGLRSRSCRIFPRFIYQDRVVNDPADFVNPVMLHKFYPNFVSISFAPFPDINVQIEYWVPGSQVVTGRTKITNERRETCFLQLEWAVLLSPTSDGKRMAPVELGMTTILTGQTANLTPVLFLTGGAQPGNSPYPSLSLPLEIPSNGTRYTQWVCSSLSEVNASFEQARQIASRNWESESARIEMLNSQQLEITTGNKDWDSAFAFAQKTAYGLFLGQTQVCNAPSFVSSRNLDQGFSLRGDGSDYSHLWNGQTPFDTYFLTGFLLPDSPQLVKGLIENFLSTQNLEGEIDWKPGLGGQRSQLLATPLLTSIAYRLYEFNDDLEYLTEIFPKLLAFVKSWFSPTHDRDEDSIPEWDHATQTGFEDHPLFSQLHSWSQGIDITTVESPDLCCYLYRECQALIAIANLTHHSEAISELEILADKLRTAVEGSWSEEFACYLYRDRDSHLSSPAEFLGELHGPGIIEIQKELQLPIRPLISIETHGEATRAVQIFIHGIGTSGGHRVENISTNRIRWHLGTGHTTSEHVYASIEQIEIHGVQDDDHVIVQAVCLTRRDQTLLLPLWAGIPSIERAKILINLTILNKKWFLSPNGLRACIDFPELGDAAEEFFSIHLSWNALIIEGLLNYDQQKKSAEVFSRLMKGVIQSLKKEMAFRQIYDSQTGKGFGERNSLVGLAPVGLFLEILGVQVINPYKIKLSGTNPFPWPVTIKYRGLTIHRQDKKTMIIFPDGQNVTVKNDHVQIISMDKI